MGGDWLDSGEDWLHGGDTAGLWLFSGLAEEPPLGGRSVGLSAKKEIEPRGARHRRESSRRDLAFGCPTLGANHEAVIRFNGEPQGGRPILNAVLRT
jgi:hypothetical protein